MPSETEDWYKLGLDKGIGLGEFFEFIIRGVYTHVLNPGDVAFDGGAHRGVHTFPLADCVGPEGLVVGFEAISSFAEKLKDRAGREGRSNVQIVSKAIGPEAGQTSFVVFNKLPGYSGRLLRERVPLEAIDSAESIIVPMTTMDITLRETGRNALRFIKLDLEGGEYDALRGSERIMSLQAPLIVLESGRDMSSRVYGHTSAEWFSLFGRHDYKVFDLFGERFTEARWTEPRLPWDFIATRRADDLAFVEYKLPNLIRSLAAATRASPTRSTDLTS